jgi:ligand-binding sensor domain-containing protein/signal transduction histidine kinase
MNCRTIYGLIIILSSLAWPCFAQQYSLRQYSSADGLPQSQVACVLEDKLGYLWIGTLGGGLGRFDGREFKVYNTFDGLVSNTIIGLLLDSKEQLWVCHPQGISKFQANQFKKFVTPGAQTNEGKLRRIFPWRDSICYLTAEGKWGSIYHDTLSPLKKITDKKILFMRPSKNKIILVFSDSTFLVKDNYGSRIVSHKKSFDRAWDIFYLHNIPIVKTEKGYFKMDAANGIFEPTIMPFQNSFLFYDSLQNIYWTATKNSMLFKEAGDKSPAAIDTVLKETEVNQVYADKQNNVWLATGGMGLYRYAKQDFDRCGSPSLRLVMAIMKDQTGAAWIGTMNSGLKRIYKNKIDNYQFGNPQYRVGVSYIKQNRLGQIWVASGAGLGLYQSRSNSFKIYSQENGLPSYSIRCFDFDEKGDLWVGTANGISYFQNGTSVKNYSTADKILGRMIFSIYYHPSTKTVYAGTEFGINTIKDGKVSSIPIPELANAVILTINPYKQSLLIGTDGAGACIYDPARGVKTFINSRNGLPSDLVYFIVADQQGFIWVGTEKGINKLLLSVNNEIVENSYYCRDNGLTGAETNHNAYFIGKEKYFGLVDGLYQYNEQATGPQTTNPLHLNDLEVFYGAYPSRSFAKTYEGFFQIPKKPVFPSDKNHLTFSFNRVDKLSPNSQKFQYYLENFDKTWSLPSAAREATYGNLPPGDYNFKIKATNSRGKWDPTPIEYPFSVEAAFYQTAKFKLLVIGILISFIVLAIYWRIRARAVQAIKIEQIRFQEKEVLRKDLARDFHDEMGNQLTRIINYVSLLKLNHNNASGKAELYDKVEAAAKLLYSGTRDFIWSIDPANDDLVKVFIHIKDFAEPLLKEKNIHFRADNKVTGQIHLPYGASREIILIFKEAVTNAFEHANAKNVSLVLEREQKKFNITLHDDGDGFEMAEVNVPNGIKNMRNRAEHINANLRIRSNKSGQGTSICLVINHHKEKYHDFVI